MTDFFYAILNYKDGHKSLNSLLSLSSHVLLSCLMTTLKDLFILMDDPYARVQFFLNGEMALLE